MAGSASRGLDPGMLIADRYRVVRKLGTGGMGSVYEAEHIAIKRRVAIKVMHGHLADRPEIVARFNREAQAATAIGHPNIIEVTDFGTLPDGMPFMVLEYLEGRDWGDDLEREGPQPLGKTAAIMTQVCRALAAAHGKGIVHRDLKPDNVFLIEREGNPNFVKVLDFGVSKFIESETSPQELGLTKTGTALGTPYYMSPEQCSGRKDVDPRADIFALGVILFRALTGAYPFDADSYPMLIMAIVTGPTPSLASVRADVPAEVVALVERMLAKRREDRPQSCAEVEAALRPYVIDTAAPVLAGGPGAAPLSPAPAVARTLALEPAPPPDARVVPGRAASRSTAALGAAIAVGAAVAASIGGWMLGTHLLREPSESSAAAGARPSDAPSPRPITSARPPPEPVRAAQPPPEPPAPTAPAAVSLRIEATPAEAVILLGDEPVSNPFEGELPRGERRRLVVRAGGHETHERDLVLDASQRIVVHLARSPARSAAPGPRERPRVVAPPPPSVSPPPPSPRQRERPVEGSGRFGL